MGVGKAVLAFDALSNIDAEPHWGRLKRPGYAAAVGALFPKWVESPAPGVFASEFCKATP